MIVAIDGPAGAGKSTVSRCVAERLGFQLIETGSLYRAVAWVAEQTGVANDDAEGLGAIAAALNVRFAFADGRNRVILSGDDVTDRLRAAAIAERASRVSAVPRVRAALLDVQRRMGRARDSVMEGRDIGTVVFPDAAVKVFLTASTDERARRRLAEEAERGEAPRSVDEVRREIEERDRRDAEREVAPMVAAEDARVVDSTGRDAASIVDLIIRWVDAARG